MGWLAYSSTYFFILSRKYNVAAEKEWLEGFGA
jgi:hypothetical protein